MVRTCNSTAPLLVAELYPEVILTTPPDEASEVGPAVRVMLPPEPLWVGGWGGVGWVDMRGCVGWSEESGGVEKGKRVKKVKRARGIKYSNNAV